MQSTKRNSLRWLLTLCVLAIMAASGGDAPLCALSVTDADAPPVAVQDEHLDRDFAAEDDRVICVQAWVMGVAGAQLGKSLMQSAEGQPGPMPVERAFQLLHRGQAKLISAVTLKLANGHTAQTLQKDGESTDLGSENDTKTAKNKNTLEFEATGRIGPHERIAIEFKYEQSFSEATFTKDDDDNKESTVDRQLHWASALSLIPGKPAVAGLTVSNNSASILVLQADVVD
jgi:hypothetical protein